MRRLMVVLAVLALGATGAMAAGGFGLFGSYWDADGDTGMGGGIKVKGELAPNLAIEIRASYLPEWDFDDDATDDAFEDFSVIPVEADLTLNFPLADALNVYAGGGIGYYVTPEFELKGAPIGASAEPDVDLDDEFGYFAVAGIEIKLNDQVALFGEAQYRWLEIEEAEIDGSDVDLDDLGGSVEADGIGFNAGLLLMW